MALYARVIGDIFRVEHRGGFARESGERYDMDIAHVLVADAGISEVVLPKAEDLVRLLGTPTPPPLGTKVDWLCEIAQGPRGLRVSIIRDEHFEAVKAGAWTPRVEEDLYSAVPE